MMQIILGTIFIVIATGLFVIARFDEEIEIRLRCFDGLVLLMAAFLNALVICSLMHNLLQCILLSIIAGSMLLACVTDCKICQVHQFVWWCSGAAAVALAGCLIVVSFVHGRYASFTGLIFFCLLQQIFFARMYGRADSHAFCICAVIAYGFDISIKGYLIHMLFSFLLLTVVQFFQKNINRKGNLKKPVAFLPYITVSFWIFMYIYT